MVLNQEKQLNTPIVSNTPDMADSDEFSALDIALSDEWQANGFPMLHRDLKALEDEG